MPSATDELRRMLDERGVEHYDHENGEPLRDLEEAGKDPATSWRVGGMSACAVPDKHGTFDIWIDHATPAQAIDATLGRGTCYDVGDSTRFVCSKCGCALDLSDLDGEPTMWVKDMADTPSYCPNCGREVVDG